MIDVNNETDFGVDEVEFAELATYVLREMNIADGAELAILFVDEPAMEQLHIQWMDEPGPTDVLSFPMDELRPGTPGAPTPAGLLGDIVVCPSVAARQAKTGTKSKFHAPRRQILPLAGEPIPAAMNEAIAEAAARVFEKAVKG